MFFKLVMEGGHVVAGKSYEMVRYLEADDISCVLAKSLHSPRLKKKESAGGIKFIKEVSWREYIRGKKKERRDPYLNRH
ncbi:MAG: hypothetical protein JSW32_05000 [Deltaproteobacteria bacterium]|nr:MAG: hypothetical protein JSW32_05000 [Deltaproteobacteria bacterium]